MHLDRGGVISDNRQTLFRATISEASLTLTYTSVVVICPCPNVQTNLGMKTLLAGNPISKPDMESKISGRLCPAQ